MRAPLAAWRRLFAVGGAPSASHVALSRTPPADRLLDPLTGARVVHAASLDALTRSLDVDDLFSRVTGAARGEADSSAASEASDSVRRKRGGRPPVAEGSEGGSAPSRDSIRDEVREAEGTRARTRRGNGEASPAVAPMRRAERAATILREMERARTTPSSTGAETNPPRVGSLPGADAKLAEAMRRVSSNQSGETEARRPAALSSDAQAGANARVVLGAPVSGIERLLAVEVPSRVATDASPRGAKSASIADDERRQVKAKTSGVEPDIARLLAGAVSRAQRAAPDSPADLSNARRSLQLENNALARDAGASRDDGRPVVDAPASSGFRGLAQRTLTHASTRAPVKRLEAEKRVSADIMHDTLDSRVADSLARVLEREARRHGIDIDEARA
ncbi:MAG: hypothetical protein ABI625_04915 [bacterium]